MYHPLRSPLRSALRRTVHDGRAGGRIKTPSDFLTGSVKWWHDPSDLTTLFQDPAGLTPVTAAGQTVGLMLCKAYNFAVESHSPYSDNHLTDWSNTGGGGTGGWAASGTNSVVLDGLQSGTSAVWAPTIGGATAVPGVSGTGVRMNFTVSNLTGGSITINNGTSFSASITANGNYSLWHGGGLAISFTGPVGRACTISGISIDQVYGIHMRQVTAAARPEYRVDANGKSYLWGDAVDDGMQSISQVTPGSNLATLWYGAQKDSDASGSVVYELGVSAAANGAFSANAPHTPTANTFGFSVRGTVSTGSRNATGNVAPKAAVMGAKLNVNGVLITDQVTSRQDGATPTTTDSAPTTPAAAFAAASLNIMRRNNSAAQVFSGRLYSGFGEFGVDTTSANLRLGDVYVASKMGSLVTLAP